jgi:Ca2+:H+ antiporter
MSSTIHDASHGAPRAAWAAPAAAWALLLAEAGGIVAYHSGLALALAAPLLAATIFAAVHHAEVVAARVGQPFGAVILAFAVTLIEASLIVAIMLSEAPAPGERGAPTAVARDTVFAAVMLVLNGVVGLCLLIGGWRHREQAFHAQGAAAALGVLGTLATLTMILPDFTVSKPGPYFTQGQLAFVAGTALGLYLLFLFVQIVRHRADFLDGVLEPSGPRPSGRAAAGSLALLLASLAAVVLLAETLSPAVREAVVAAGLPGAFMGVVIAAVTLMPEGASALRAAWANRPQTSLNLALGSALASVGLTIPAVAAVALWLDLPLALGLATEHVVLLALTLFVATLTLATGRTTVLQGGVHLVILGAFLLVAAVP